MWTSTNLFPGLPTRVSLGGDRGQLRSIYHAMDYGAPIPATWAPTPQGKYRDAEPLYRRVMEIMEATLGKDHPQYSTSLSNLGGVLEKQVRAGVFRFVLVAYHAGIDALPLCCSI